MLHGQDRRGKKAKQDRLIVKFVKKYIHYAKNLIQPKLTDEVTFSNPGYRAIQSWRRYYSFALIRVKVPDIAHLYMQAFQFQRKMVNG